MSDPRKTERRDRHGWLSRSWPWFLLAAALGLWTFGGSGGPLLEHGVSAPELRVQSAEGEVDAYAGEGVTVLAFWATWCQACRAEGPVLSRVQERIASHGDRVVGLSVDERPLGEIQRAAEAFGMTYPIVLGTRADAERYGVELLPTIYVVSADRQIVTGFTGGVGEDELMEAVEHARGHANHHH